MCTNGQPQMFDHYKLYASSTYFSKTEANFLFSYFRQSISIEVPKLRRFNHRFHLRQHMDL